jgi:hypothetical protein
MRAPHFAPRAITLALVVAQIAFVSVEAEAQTETETSPELTAPTPSTDAGSSTETAPTDSASAKDQTPEQTSAPDAGPSGVTLPSIKVSGYAEVFYQLNFNWPSNLVTAYRGFDDRSSSFTVENSALDVTGQLGPVSVRIALQIGHTPASYYSAEPNYPAEAGVGDSGPELWRLIQQANVSYQIPVGRGLLGEAGIFLSPIGVEALAIKDDWNWSRSNLFFALPYYHAGFRFTYPFTDRLTGVLYLVNGWNDIVNKNPYPCMSGLLTYAIDDRLTLNLLYFGGVELPTGDPEGQPWRNLFDVNVTWNANGWLSLAAQADAGFERNNFGTSSWWTGAAYVRVRAHRKLYVAARADYFHEHDSISSTGATERLFFPADNVHSETLTADFRPVDNFSLRLEYRHDTADTPIYYRGTVARVEGLDVPNAKDQQTLTLGVTGWF